MRSVHVDNTQKIRKRPSIIIHLVFSFVNQCVKGDEYDSGPVGNFRCCCCLHLTFLFCSDLSSHHDLAVAILECFSSPSEEIKSAASFALGLFDIFFVFIRRQTTYCRRKQGLLLDNIFNNQ